MAIMSDENRAECTTEVIRELTARGIDPKVLKTDIRIVVDANDQWVSDNAAAANNAIPQPQRSATPLQVKSIIFRAVVAKRYEKGA